jgi:hypothetical protein
MRNMLALFAAALLTAIGLGWYLGWYKVSSQPASVPGQHDVQIHIDTKKIGTDLQNGEEKIKQIIKEKTKDEAKSPADGKKVSDNLTLPSPQLNMQTGDGASLQLNGGGEGPLFQFQSDKGPSLQIGNGEQGAFIKIGGDNKK